MAGVTGLAAGAGGGAPSGESAGARVKRLVLDTNVWLDWLVFDEPTLAPLRAAQAAGRVEIVMDEACEAELARVLAYDLGKHTIGAEAQAACIARCRRVAKRVDVIANAAASATIGATPQAQPQAQPQARPQAQPRSRKRRQRLLRRSRDAAIRTTRSSSSSRGWRKRTCS